ncbi:hypothetical protein COLO4_02160, partial [Corchorus olitorius]
KCGAAACITFSGVDRARHSALYARDTGAVFGRAGHLCPAVLCAAAAAGPLCTVWRVTGRQQYFPFSLHRDTGAGLTDYRPLVRCCRSQICHGHRADAGFRLHADFGHHDKLARHSADAGAYWPVAQR